jgi:hypothetical protein
MGQDSRRLDITQHNGDFRRDFAGGNGTRNGHEIGAFAGTEHADAQWIVHFVLNIRPRTAKKVETLRLNQKKRPDNALSGL